MNNPSCPFLPEEDQNLTARDVGALGDDRGPLFYEITLRYAQTLWRRGLPARALLQINRGMGALITPEDRVPPIAYDAVAWIIRQRPEGQFLGNPRRHYQHLATRMVEPRKELRVWRAWACWALARAILPEAEFPPDIQQLLMENLVEPTEVEIAEGLRAWGLPGEVDLWKSAFS